MSFPIILRPRGLLFKGVVALTLSFAGITQVFALPAFARQTGDSCDACHVGGYGPQLTSHGMKFKLGGYSDSDGKEGHIPLSGMLIENYTHTSADQNPAPADGYDPNNNLATQEISLFVSGKLAEHLGTFTQITYAGIDKVTELDNTEFRYAKEGQMFGQDAVYGLTFNNNPGMQDPFNILPAWRFPYTSSDLAPGPEGAPILDDGLAGVYGITAYAQLKDGVYVEAGNYMPFSRGFLERVNRQDSDPAVSYEKADSFNPYARAAYYKDKHKFNYSGGVVLMSAKVKDETTGDTSKASNLGFDGHYQFLGNRKSIYGVDGSYIMQSGDFKSNELNVAGYYYINNTYGATGRYFSIGGSDAPASSGITLQGDWTPFGKEDSAYAPWANLRLGLQYTMYNKLNDDSSNASDSNTIMAFAWLAI